MNSTRILEAHSLSLDIVPYIPHGVSCSIVLQLFTLNYWEQQISKVDKSHMG